MIESDALLSALNAFKDNVRRPWSADSVAELASHTAAVGSAAGWLLEGDYNAVVLRWLAESVIPTVQERDQSHVQKGKIFSQAIQVVSALRITEGESSSSSPQALALAKFLGQAAWSLIEEDSTRRLSLEMSDRNRLLMEAGESPRCYLCGATFGTTAVQRFLHESEVEPKELSYVDFLFPRGIRGSDFLIHVDHVRPLAQSGPDNVGNLRLACAFCNQAKSDVLTILDRMGYSEQVSHPQLGRIRTPNRSWVVRLLALSGSCSVCGECSRTAKLLVAPPVWSRFINPMNLRVYCESHDPISDLRLVPRELFKSSSRAATRKRTTM